METAILCSGIQAAIKKSLTDPLKQQRTSKIKMYACQLSATMTWDTRIHFKVTGLLKRNTIGTYRTTEETILYYKHLLMLLLSNNYVWEHVLRTTLKFFLHQALFSNFKSS